MATKHLSVSRLLFVKRCAGISLLTILSPLYGNYFCKSSIAIWIAVGLGRVGCFQCHNIAEDSFKHFISVCKPSAYNHKVLWIFTEGDSELILNGPSAVIHKHLFAYAGAV